MTVQSPGKWFAIFSAHRVFKSIGSKLFLYMMVGALFGLGGIAYFFYQVLEERAKDEIRSTLNNQVSTIEGRLSRIEESVVGMTSAAITMHRMGINDPEFYRNLALEFFLKRPNLVVGNGFGQTPFQIVPNRQWYWPYFYVDQGEPGAVGQPLPAPYQGIRYAELFSDDNYPEQDYYTIPVAAGKPVWIDPYDWYGIIMMSHLNPFFDNNGKMIGVAVADVNVTVLTRQVNKPVTREGGYFAILSEQGNLLAYPPEPEKAEDRLNFQEIPLFNRVWQKLQSDQAGLIQTDSFFLAYQRIPSTNWLMLATVPRSLVLGPVVIITVAGAVGAGIVLALVLALFVKRLNSGLQPILDECSKVIEADTQNKVKGRTSTKGLDELGILTHSFNRMTARLNELIGNLEEQVSEQKRAEDALLESERALATLIDNLPGMAYRSLNDPDWTMEFISDGCLQLTGYAPEELLRNKKLPYSDLIHPDDQDVVWNRVQEAVAQHNPFELIYRIRTKSGQEKWNWEKGVGVYSDEGEVLALEGFVVDITENKQTQEELRKHRDHLEELVKERTAELKKANDNMKIEIGERKRAEFELRKHRDNLEELVSERTRELEAKAVELEDSNRHLQEADRLKSVFLASVSHELRTPLNSIIGFTGIILQGMVGDINEEQRKQLIMVRNSADHLLRLVQDVLDIAEIEAGRAELLLEEFEFNGILKEVEGRFSSVVMEKGLGITIDISEGISLVSDRKRIKQLVMNLVDNAVKFTDTGSIRVAANIVDDDKLEVKVTDTGIGIKEEDMDKLFLPLRQVDTSLKTRHEGAGLGLYLNKKLADLLGCRISVKSKFGKGSEFLFTLPIKYEENLIIIGDGLSKPQL